MDGRSLSFFSPLGGGVVPGRPVALYQRLNLEYRSVERGVDVLGGLAITLKELTKTFDKRVVVDSVSLDIPSGVVYGLIGPNGAGKTTIVRMLSTLLRPTSGT